MILSHNGEEKFNGSPSAADGASAVSPSEGGVAAFSFDPDVSSSEMSFDEVSSLILIVILVRMQIKNLSVGVYSNIHDL